MDIKILAVLLGVATSLSAYGEAMTMAATPSNTPLDQSQAVLFDTFSPNTFALQLLKVKNKFHPNDIVWGGSSQFDLQNWQGDTIEEYPLGSTYKSGHGFFWTSANVDLMANINSWNTVFLSVTDNHIGRNDPDANDISLSHALIILGDLTKSPLYLTTGINTIPFGSFVGSGPWDTPLTSTYFNPAQSLQASIAFDKNGWNSALTAFSPQQKNGTYYAYNLMYQKDTQTFGYSLGAGYLTDLTLSNTTSAFTLPNTLQRFSRHTNNGDLGSVLDFNASLRYRQITLAGEFDKGSNKVNGNKSFPKAYAITANYLKNIAGKDTVFGITRSVAIHLKDVPAPLTGYDNLASAFAGLKNTWALNVSRPILKNTWIGLDFQKMIINAGIRNPSQAHTYTTTVDLVTYL